MATPVRARPAGVGRNPESPLPSVPGASQEEIRRQNLGAVLRYVHLHGPTSRAELTSRLGLNRSTIGALAADLVASGLVTEEAPTTARRAGRPSLVVSPRSDRVYAHALSIDADRLRAARVGLGGRILDLREVARPGGMTAVDAVGPLADLVRDMERSVAPDALLVGGAVAVTDTTCEADGTIRIAGVDESLGVALEAEFTAGPGFVAGDLADIAGLAEHIRGVAAGIDDLIYLHGDLGISAGIIVDGRLVIGHRGHSGKVGHMVVNPNGLLCGCGSRGCWETEIGEAALLRHAGRDPGDRGAVAEVLRAAADGDRTAREAVEQIADWLGFGVANLVNVVNPDAVVFGGSLRDIFTAGADAVRSRLGAMPLPGSREHLRLEAAALGRDAVLIGAAELAFDKLLADPLNVGVAGQLGADDPA
ncbi:Sugar kinase of the NBD/HSP70 family, may contain an N-terminal HTH domain [Micromonospora cremea]|uniref:Sugar kinase of the NBD/HSP70 family, may contain an N-terminal HTH domain n=1 Tax=Micromonospora cremea TaxID=709881 RepID=A0A1N6B6P6_9ACTN|nr:Sugar kinase of the NBD/HSP70 family, may contain an N-terminal HTH domain [Micromonospora cremea]